MTPATANAPDSIARERTVRAQFTLQGAVQGIGFRPFVFRLATQLGLTGWVNNSPRGVRIEVEGSRPRLRQFRRRLETEKPAHSFIQEIETSFAQSIGYAAFAIRPSALAGSPAALVMPDLATCPECRAEILDPNNRRYFYPFTNCTQCGPRFSIVETLPYDRANTSMKRFEMCEQCQAEYANPADRRFHAQPNACPACGPHLELWDRSGGRLEPHPAALEAAAEAIRRGAIVAVKGLGGFQLMAAADDDRAVERLRALKHREAKPFALMCPAMTTIRALCEVSPVEDWLLRSAAAPIVLLRRRTAATARRGGLCIAPAVAPGNPRLGVMLPYTPLHHLLLTSLGLPVVATSGNRAGEPICIEERDALERLGGITDLFLVHDRPIVRPVDDSVVHVVLGREQVLRRARGYAPLPISLSPSPPSALAVGAQDKNTVAVSANGQVFLSQHLGDLDNAPACAVFRRTVNDLGRLCGARPTLVAADGHPDYHSTQFAQASDLPQVSVQHHYAHVLSCMAEHGLDGSLLGIAWDGTGLGLDGTLWGGEFLKITPQSWERAAHLRTFPLPGGERAVYEPRRTALGLLYEMFGEATFAMKDLAPLRAFTAKEIDTLRQMLVQQINGPRTSSAGRLFDAVASLIGLRQRVQFEGQAAMDLEFAVDALEGEQAYPMSCAPHTGNAGLIVDWSPMIQALIDDTRSGVPAWEVTVKFHNALAEAIVAVALQVGQARVVLSGGCFQNKLLTERAVELLRAAGFQAYWHQRVPSNDGGVALGQIAAAAREPRRHHRLRPKSP